MLQGDFDYSPDAYVPPETKDPDRRSAFIRSKEKAAVHGKVFNPCPICREEGEHENADKLNHRLLCNHYIGTTKQGQCEKEGPAAVTHYSPLLRFKSHDALPGEEPHTQLAGYLLPIEPSMFCVKVSTCCRVYHPDPESVLPEIEERAQRINPKSAGEALGAAINAAVANISPPPAKSKRVIKDRKSRQPVAAGE